MIESAARLAELEIIWHALWSSLTRSTPFQSPDWLLPWVTHYCGDQVLSFAFWNDGELVGLAPLFMYRRETCRRLLLLGTGNTDYLDAIFHPAYRDACCRALLSAVEQSQALWDECNLQRLPAGSPLLEGTVPEQRLLSRTDPQEPCPVLDFAESGRMSLMLKRSRYYAARLRQRHSCSIELATAASLGESLEALQRLHRERWHKKGMPGALTHENDYVFHRDVSLRFLRNGVLRLYCLYIEHEIAAVLYGFCNRSRMYFYLSGFDPKYSQLSIGTVLLGHAVEQAIAGKCEYFDFLTGRESYKYRWGATDQPMFARTLTKKT